MNDLENKKYWIWFSLIEKLSIKNKLQLLKIYGSPNIIYKLNKNNLITDLNIKEEIANNIQESKNENILNKHIQFMKHNNIDIINIDEREYPTKLKDIYDPPISLFIKGNKQILNETGIAIIGCRDCSSYGKKAAQYFAYNLAKENINIISGLAKGIDSYGHIGCIHSKGKTIAVIGNGLDTIYPKENYELAKLILENNGAIISEYPCGTKPKKMNFPARNRIVSGISNGIIVVEAKEKSGTLITVDFALEQGKDIFVVPGNINSINSIGTNELIKQGAKLITTYKDVLIK